VKNVLRQGDVCLIAVDEIPEGAKKHPAKGRKVILALGEATGHHHRFEFLDTSHNVKLYVAEGGARYVHVTKVSALIHEEHSAISVPVGKYLLPVQMEYQPKELVRVAD
jgi:hypothetical protein